MCPLRAAEPILDKQVKCTIEGMGTHRVLLLGEV